MKQHYDIDWLLSELESNETLKFVYFWGHSKKSNVEVDKACFSQWFESAFSVGGVTYKTSEHWMMAQKALLFNDKNSYDKIIACHKPGEAKDLGRNIIGFDEITWNKHRFEIVKLGNIHKFNQNPVLANFLINTHPRILVEASPLDNIWGIGLSQDDEDIKNIYAWKGLNLLGFVLMEVRDFLISFGLFTPLENSMLPPWEKHANASEDMFWKMGIGEDYLISFSQFFHSLSEQEKTIYKLYHPAPYNWNDFYE